MFCNKLSIFIEYTQLKKYISDKHLGPITLYIPRLSSTDDRMNYLSSCTPFLYIRNWRVPCIEVLTQYISLLNSYLIVDTWLMIHGMWQNETFISIISNISARNSYKKSQFETALNLMCKFGFNLFKTLKVDLVSFCMERSNWHKIALRNKWANVSFFYFRYFLFEGIWGYMSGSTEKPPCVDISYHRVYDKFMKTRPILFVVRLELIIL